MIITNDHTSDPIYLAWAHHTWLKKERKENEKARSGKLKMIMLKEKADMVLAK
jgi:hypothetical protein